MGEVAQNFHLGDILSVTTGRLLSPGGMADLHKFLDWMTGDQLFTHQLPRACDECAQPLLDQHPQLTNITVPEDLSGEDAVRAWLAGQVAIYGETLSVVPLRSDGHTRIDPVSELRAMRPDMPVIAVVHDDS